MQLVFRKKPYDLMIYCFTEKRTLLFLVLFLAQNVFSEEIQTEDEESRQKKGKSLLANLFSRIFRESLLQFALLEEIEN